ncbi:tudor domain-containing protein 1-like [Antedon mediterranea]|uniref:tudor domain-containing protein 1-like n=1 Tax=Antedon mediterranea TaxID=105859 RepID=UPI003AF9BAEE
MSSKKRVVAEVKKKLNEKLLSVEEQASFLYKFIDDIISKPCSDAQLLISQSDNKSFLKNYSKANQELEGCLDTLFLIRTSLPTLDNDTCSSDEEDGEESVSDNLECSKGNGVPSEKSGSVTGSMSVDVKTQLEEGISVGSDHSLSYQSSFQQTQFNQLGGIGMIGSVSEVQKNVPSIKEESAKKDWFEVEHGGSQIIKGSCLDNYQSLHTVKPSGDGFQLNTASVQEIAKPPVMKRSSRFESNTSNLPTQQETCSAIVHSIKYEPDTISKLLQQSAMQPKIPNSTFTDGTVLKVLVTEVVSPSIFWIQPVSSSLASLMQRLSVAYGGGKGDSLTIPVIGMACCSCFTQDNCWYRTRIIDIYPSVNGSEVEVKVVYVDYGNCERLPLNRLRYLLPEFASLQAQAICSGLAKVKPPGVKSWSHEHTLFFVKLVVNQNLTATVSFRPGTLAPLVDLTYDLMANQASNSVFTDNDTSPTIKVNVAELMIKNGQAVPFSQITRPKKKISNSQPKVAFSVSQCQDIGSSPATPEDQLEVLSPITKAKMICSRLKKDNASVKDESIKLRSSSGVSICSSSKSLSVPRLDIGIKKAPKKEESVRKGRGRGRRKVLSYSKSISDGSSEDGIQIGISSRKNAPPRIPSFQKDFITQSETNVKDRPTVTSNQSLLPKTSPPSNKSATVPPAKTTKVVSEVPTSLAERKNKIEAGMCINIAVSDITSPTEFYSHIISSDAPKLDYLMDELNDYLNTSSSEEVDTNFDVGAICSAKYSEDERWCRVKILEMKKQKMEKSDQEEEMVFIHYVDFGNTEWVRRSEIRKLPSWFFDLPPQVIRCSLSHVYPKKRDAKEDSVTEDGWSREDIAQFGHLTGYLQRISAKCISTEETSNMVIHQVILKKVIDGVQSCINEQMVTLGHAESDMFEAQCDIPVVRIDHKDLKQECAPTTESPSSVQPVNSCIIAESVALDNWNPMMEDFISQRNAYNIDVDDPGIATVGYKSDVTNKVCRFYARGDLCFQGDNCQYLHSSEIKRETVDAYWNDNPLSLPDEGSCVAMQVKSYYSASHFWAQLPFGAKALQDVKVERHEHALEEEGETLESLVESINNIYGKSSHTTHTTDLLLKADGELVCCKYQADNKWYRARVTSTNAEENTVQVFYLDYGNSEVVPESLVRPMLPQFLHLPFQAVECFLYNVSINDGKTEEARKVMEELTVDKTLVALVKASMASRTLHVILIDTSKPGNDLYLHQELIDRGLATSQPYDQQQPIGKKSKQYDRYANCVPG